MTGISAGLQNRFRLHERNGQQAPICCSHIFQQQTTRVRPGPHNLATRETEVGVGGKGTERTSRAGKQIYVCVVSVGHLPAFFSGNYTSTNLDLSSDLFLCCWMQFVQQWYSSRLDAYYLTTYRCCIGCSHTVVVRVCV